MIFIHLKSNFANWRTGGSISLIIIDTDINCYFSLLFIHSL